MKIEPFFRVYKTGCRVEEIQLETTARLVPLEETYLAAFDAFPQRWRSVVE